MCAVRCSSSIYSIKHVIYGSACIINRPCYKSIIRTILPYTSIHGLHEILLIISLRKCLYGQAFGLSDHTHTHTHDVSWYSGNSSMLKCITLFIKTTQLLWLRFADVYFMHTLFCGLRAFAFTILQPLCAHTRAKTTHTLPESIMCWHHVSSSSTLAARATARDNWVHVCALCSSFAACDHQLHAPMPLSLYYCGSDKHSHDHHTIERSSKHNYALLCCVSCGCDCVCPSHSHWRDRSQRALSAKSDPHTRDTSHEHEQRV